MLLYNFTLSIEKNINSSNKKSMKKNLLSKFFTTAGIFLSVSLATVTAQDWPQWRGTNRDARVSGFKAPAEWPQQLKQDWKISVGFADATPALVNNKLYVFTRQGENEVLQCLDAATGKQIWQSEGYPAAVVTGAAASHPGPRSSPAVAEGKVITLGVAGDLACFDAATGKLLWRYEKYKGAVPRFFAGMSPLVVSGTCIAHLGGPAAGKFIAFDLVSGNVKWETDGEGAGYASPAIMNVDGTKQVVFQTPTKLVSLNITDGVQLWEYATPVGTGRAEAAASPIVDQHKIYYTGNLNGVNAIEINKQGAGYVINKLWTNPDFCTKYNTPVLKDGFLYGISNQSRIFCINAGTGQTAWSDDKPQKEFATIIDAGSVLVALSSISNLIVLKPDGKAYSQLAAIKVSDNAVYAQPVLSGNRIYIKDNELLTAFTTK
jgi:outer membrane protein assembly factor BamB